MKLSHLTDAKPKGRELNHLEDLVLFYGQKGAQDALEILHALLDDEQDLSIKWDGRAALFYGRDEMGQFALGTKGNWAKGLPLRSPDEAFEYITTAGKGEPWREDLGHDLADMFPMLEYSVPDDFVGFVMGDLLYSPIVSPKIETNDQIQFTPNQVTYAVDKNTDLGMRISTTEVGFALHLVFDQWGDKIKQPINDDLVEQLNSNQVMALGVSRMPKNFLPDIDKEQFSSIATDAEKHGDVIDDLLAKKPGFSDIPDILYRFSNHAVRAGIDADTDQFFNWLPMSKVSMPKQEKLKKIHATTPMAFENTFCLFNNVRAAKNSLINELDKIESEIHASTHGHQGGEGYVSHKYRIKLVPRHRWKPT